MKCLEKRKRRSKSRIRGRIGGCCMARQDGICLLIRRLRDLCLVGRTFGGKGMDLRMSVLKTLPAKDRVASFLC